MALLVSPSLPPWTTHLSPHSERDKISEIGPLIMPKYVQPQSNACTACARTKRRCGRQIPLCARCADRGLECSYSANRDTSALSYRPLLPNYMEPALTFSEDQPRTATMRSGNEHTSDLSLAHNGEDYPNPVPVTHDPSVRFYESSWFTAPTTWDIVHDGDALAAEAVTRTQMKEYIVLVQSWMERWCSTGSNPFVHHRLYNATFPASLQIAYATLASYIHRTPANTDIVLRIVEDRSVHLLRENGAVPDKFIAQEWAYEEDKEDIDLIHQLSRVHALMIYQIIGLFDGDTRARYVAEGRLGIQVNWTSKLFRSAASRLSAAESMAGHALGSESITTAQHHWYLWILSESIRRTWLVAMSVSCVFSALQQRWSACPGGIMYTNRSGLWGATTAAAWQKQCVEKDTAFLQRFDCAELFDNADPADVDEFGIAMLDMTCGKEAVEQWRIQCS